eukprot:347386-Pelagomonas_calceolata.AAC.4
MHGCPCFGLMRWATRVRVLKGLRSSQKPLLTESLLDPPCCYHHPHFAHPYAAHRVASTPILKYGGRGDHGTGTHEGFPVTTAPPKDTHECTSECSHVASPMRIVGNIKSMPIIEYL